MRTLHNHLILFDAECPMCRLYTHAFTRSGMLDANGRLAYQSATLADCPMVDRRRAVNEIALVNIQTGEVTYGIGSLFKVIGHTWPVFGPLFGWKPFVWFMARVYAFISYNRRVIAPPAQPDGYAIQPDFKLNYRISYLIFTWLLTSYILTTYAHLLTGVVPPGNSYREYLICGGQLLFQGGIVALYDRRKLWNYLGNMMTISCAGALLLLPGLAVHHFSALPPLIYTCYFMLVAGAMLLEHIRRSKLLGLGWLPSCTWVIYRLGVLIGIYLFN